MNLEIIVILFSLAGLHATLPPDRAIEGQARQQHAAGHYREAERLFRSALADLQQKAPRDPHIPELLNDIAAECHLLGKYPEAAAHYQDALSGLRDNAAPPETMARVLTNLGVTQRALGRYPEAEASYLQALQARESALTLSNLADLYRMQGKLAQALPLAQRAVESERRLDYLQTLAAIHAAAGRLDQAAAIYREALDSAIARNGDEHPGTATTKNNLAGIDLKLGNYAEAEQLTLQAMATWTRSLGLAHPRVAVAAANLGQALRFQQQYTAAALQFERALEILQAAGAGADADRAHCLANFADMNYQQGAPTKAVDLYRQAIDAAQQAFGADHPETALLMARLAEVRRGQGLYAESVKLYRRALPILESQRAPQDEDLRVVRRRYDDVLKESARTMLIAK